MTLAVQVGKLVGEVDKSGLNLPSWLWLLSAIFPSLPGVILTAVAGALAKSSSNEDLENRLDLEELTEGLFPPSGDGMIRIAPEFDRVEVDPNGVFLRGNLLVN